MNRDDLIQQLATLPHEISAAEHDLLTAQRDLENTQGALQGIELKTRSEVAQMVGTDGKKAFTNDTLRQAEVESRLETNDTYAEIQVSVDYLTNKRDELRLAVSLLQNRFSAAKTIARLIGGPSDV